MAKKFAIGIDIGGTNIKFGVVDSKGSILEKGDLKTGSFATIESFVAGLKNVLNPIFSKYGKENFEGIGIGAPNGNVYTGTIEYAPNLKWKGVVPVAALIKDAFNLPAYLTNDANAAAVGEMLYGAAVGMRDFIMITLGTGVGSGIVANGQLIVGHDGYAGELGHCIVIPGGRLHYSTGFKGSLESYASATGVVLTAKELLETSNEASLLRDYPGESLNSKVIYECAVEGDKIARQVFEFTGKVLGEALANFVMFSSPEAIILFGGLTKAGDIVLNPIKENMEKNLLTVFRNKVKIIISKLPEADAAILGASSLVWGIKQ